MPRNHRSGDNNALQKRPAARVSRGRNEVRIIGGRWRGRKIRFPPAADIRPSPDRVRETLFNWLAPMIRGARCLDLFAGSGALGFESLSRGAASVVVLDRDPAVVRHLKSLAIELAPDAASVIQADAAGWLAGPAEPFDIVFLDPPFGSGLLPGLLQRLAGGGWLAPGALVYIECAAADGPPTLPRGWHMHRSGRAGDVGYHLAAGPAAETPSPASESNPAGEGGPPT
jgi:16S rRNA (guanine966-N2)-methyltransferase